MVADRLARMVSAVGVGLLTLLETNDTLAVQPRAALLVSRTLVTLSLIGLTAILTDAECSGITVPVGAIRVLLALAFAAGVARPRFTFRILDAGFANGDPIVPDTFA